MKILGYLGSPRVKGLTGRLLQSTLDGAASSGAEVKRIDLIKCSIKFCMGCGNCYSKNPELSIGVCPLKDDMAGILEEYMQADGYVYASPTYDMYVTALMKMFLERKIAFTYKAKEDAGLFPTPRPGVAVNFTKKASMIVTGNSADEFKEVMGDPCFEAMEGDLIWEQIDTVDTLYVGGVETIPEEVLAERMDTAYKMGKRLVEEIEKSRQ